MVVNLYHLQPFAITCQAHSDNTHTHLYTYNAHSHTDTQHLSWTAHVSSDSFTNINVAFCARLVDLVWSIYFNYTSPHLVNVALKCTSTSYDISACVCIVCVVIICLWFGGMNFIAIIYGKPWILCHLWYSQSIPFFFLLTHSHHF